MAHTPSIYQSNIYNFLEHSTANAVIDAVAGSGKSTTLIELLKKIDPSKKVLFLAFNKSIVEELKLKIGKMPNVKVQTLHSLGASAITRSFFDVDIQANKYTAYVNGLLYHDKEGTFTDGIEDSDYKEFKSNIMSLIDLCRVNLVNTVEGAQDLAYKHGLILKGKEIKIAHRAIKWGLKNEELIDFTDMIFFPIIKNIKMPQYDYVFIDECQDLNACQRELFLKCINPEGGRFVAVGDPKQAIYGFAGADAKSFKILQNLPNTESLPLSVCYRCDADIIRLAQGIVPQIEYREGAPDGVVEQDASITDVRDGDMILCRVTAPLVDVCMDYISRGIKAYVKGRDLGANLIKMILDANKAQISDVLKYYDLELFKLANKYAKENKCSMAEANDSEGCMRLQDKIDTLRVLSRDLKFSQQVVDRIGAIFSDASGGICLSTIHKSKGLENDRVFILCPEKLLHERCMGIEWMAEQEHNLVYVAYTRAKHYLGFIRDYEGV